VYHRMQTFNMGSKTGSFKQISVITTVACDFFSTYLITEGMNAFVPKHVHRSINSEKFQPFNADLRHLVHRKHSLWNHCIKSRNDQVYKEYKIVRNKVKRETVKLIQKEQAKISAECKSNPKIFWKYVNRKTKNKDNVSDLKWQNDKGNERTAEIDSDKAHNLADFFLLCTQLNIMRTLNTG